MARGNPRGTFGLVSSRGKRGGSSVHFRGRGRGRGRGGASSGSRNTDQSRPEPTLERADDATQGEDKFEDVRLRDEIDEKLGFTRFAEGSPRDGWLVNMHPVSAVCLWGTIFAETRLKCRLWSKTMKFHRACQQWTITSFKTTGGCLKPLCFTNLTFSSLAK